MKARLSAHDAALDYSALREAHAAAADYAPNSSTTLADRRAVESLLEKRDFAAAAARIDQWLARDPLNPFAHMGGARAHRELGDTRRADFHAAVVDGLYAAICEKGQGLALDNPCRVLSIDEEHFFLGISGLKLDGQWGILCTGDRPCEAYAVTDPKQHRSFTVYFDISLPYAFQQAHESHAPR